jgi:hypothetical protein
MIQVELDPATKHLDPDFERKVRECKLACKEEAGWRCEYVYPNGKRCRAIEGQLKRKKREKRATCWMERHPFTWLSPRSRSPQSQTTTRVSLRPSPF